MSEIKHTPGPWEYRPKELDDWGLVRNEAGALVAVAKDSSVPLPELDAHRAANTDPYEANGRLIAAAPELLEILVAADKLIIWENNGFDREFQDRVEEVIRKAAPPTDAYVSRRTARPSDLNDFSGRKWISDELNEAIGKLTRWAYQDGYDTAFSSFTYSSRRIAQDELVSVIIQEIARHSVPRPSPHKD